MGILYGFYRPIPRPAGGEEKAQAEHLEALLKCMNLSVAILYVHIAIFYEMDIFATVLQFH